MPKPMTPTQVNLLAALRRIYGTKSRQGIIPHNSLEDYDWRVVKGLFDRNHILILTDGNHILILTDADGAHRYKLADVATPASKVKPAPGVRS